MRLLRKLEGRAGCWQHLEGTEGQKTSCLPLAVCTLCLHPGFQLQLLPELSIFLPWAGAPSVAGVLSMIGMPGAGLCRRGTGTRVWEVPSMGTATTQSFLACA